MKKMNKPFHMTFTLFAYCWVLARERRPTAADVSKLMSQRIKLSSNTQNACATNGRILITQYLDILPTHPDTRIP